MESRLARFGKAVKLQCAIAPGAGTALICVSRPTAARWHNGRLP
jgi:hypothetical protein